MKDKAAKFAMQLFWGVLVFICFSMCAMAEEIRDPCDGLSFSCARYFNFSQTKDILTAWELSSTPDPTYLSMISPSSDAVVLYEISGASSLDVALYSEKGTFATRTGQGDEYIMGAVVPSSLDGSWQRLRYSRANDTTYLQQQGRMMPGIYSASGEIAFSGNETSTGPTVWYGLTIWVSNNGIDFYETEMMLSHVQMMVGANRHTSYYETYTAMIPPGSKYIKLTINDCLSFRNSQNQGYPNTRSGTQRLALVVFTGSHLQVGPPTAQLASSSQAEQTTDSLETLLSKLLANSKEDDKTSSKVSSSAKASTSSKASSGSKTASNSKSSSPRPGSASATPDQQEIQYSVEPIPHVVQGAARSAGNGQIYALIYIAAAAALIFYIFHRNFKRGPS